MVDIVKVELAGPCKSKFSLSTSSFVINICTRIKNSLLWHVYGISWYQLFKIVDNVTEIIGYIDSHLGFWNLYWRLSYFLTNLVRFNTLKTYILGVYSVNPIFRGKYCKSMRIRSRVWKYLSLAFRHFSQPTFLEWPLRDHVSPKFNC